MTFFIWQIPSSFIRVPDRPDEHDEPESEFIECPNCEDGLKAVEDYEDFMRLAYIVCPRCHGTGEVLNPNLSDHEQAMALWARNRY